MTKSSKKELEEYQEYVKEKLSQLTPILQKTSVGDFSAKIKIPEKQDEFSELLVGLSLLLDDLREMDKAKKEAQKEMKKRILELEKWKELVVKRELKMVELKKTIKELKRKISELQKKN